ncbi:hypothetical protein LTR08_001507 [Meristemomyces frigidus]|nr:hypothetical protein LTR08_001507 [Meristemomyces frigidus]
MPPNRMTKNRPQPIRYRPGKAEVEDEVSEDESAADSDEEEEAAPKAAPPKATSFPSQKKLAVDLSRADQQRSAAPKATAKEPAAEDLDGFVTASESSDDNEAAGSSVDEEEGDDGESSAAESDSSADAPPKPLLRPTFVSKARRAAQHTPSSAPAPPVDPYAAAELRRREKADEMLQAQLERDVASRAAGRKAWDDDAEIAPEVEVDDADDVDAEAEVAAWKLRELKRVRRERAGIEAKEREREEVGRRRELGVAERALEDEGFIAAQRGEREGRGEVGFMRKYYHKGAFFSGLAGGDGEGEEVDEEVRAALSRDLAGARFEDEVGDKGILPEYMRIRDMTRLGRKGGTKYRDLREEDTGRWGVEGGRREGGGGGRGEPGDQRFRSEGGEQTGANSVVVGERRRREDGVESGGGRELKRGRFE